MIYKSKNKMKGIELKPSKNILRIFKSSRGYNLEISEKQKEYIFEITNNDLDNFRKSGLINKYFSYEVSDLFDKDYLTIYNDNGGIKLILEITKQQKNQIIVRPDFQKYVELTDLEF